MGLWCNRPAQDPFTIQTRVRNSVTLPSKMKNAELDPKKCEVIASLVCESYLIVRVTYTGYPEFDGDKILVYQDIDLDDLLDLKGIDPEFNESAKTPTPIATFKPTAEGWRMAKIFVEAMY